MVEYVIVVVFGILVISGSGGAIETLINTLQDNYRGYSYAVSLSQMPDYADAAGANAACVASGTPAAVCNALTDPAALTADIESYKNSFNQVKSTLSQWKNPPSVNPLDYYTPPTAQDLFCLTSGLC